MRKIFVLTLIFMFLVSSGSFSPVLANTKPPTPTISINKTAYSVGETVTFNFSYQNATGVALGIDHDNNNGSWYRYDTPSVTGKTTYSRSFDKPGTYAVYVSVSNTYGYSDSQKVTFKVAEKPPAGDKPNNQTDKSNRRGDRPINQTDKPNQRGDRPNTQTDKPNNQQPNKPNNQTDKSIQRDDRPNTHTDKPNSQQPDKPTTQTDKANNQQSDKSNNQTDKPSQRIDRPSTQTGKPNNQQVDRPSTNTDKSSQQIDRPTNQNDKPNTQTNAPVIRRNAEPKITANLPRTVFGEGEAITVSWTTTGTVNNQFGITVKKEPYGPTTADDVEVKNFVSGNSYTLKTLPAGKYRVGVTEWKNNAWGTASQLIYFEVKAKTPPDSASTMPPVAPSTNISVGQVIPPKPTIAVNKTTFYQGETVTFNFAYQNATGAALGIDHDNNNGSWYKYDTPSVTGKTTYSRSFDKPGTYAVYISVSNAQGYSDSQKVTFKVVPPTPASKIIASLPKTVYVQGEQINLSWTTEGQVNNQFGITVRKEPYAPTVADDVEVKNYISGNSYTLKTLPAGKYRVGVTEWKGNAWGVASQLIYFEVKPPPLLVSKITAKLPQNSYNEGEPIVISWTTEGQVNNQFNVTVSKEPYTNADNVESNNSVSGNSHTLKTLPAGKYRVKVTEMRGNALGAASNTIDFEVKNPPSELKISVNKTIFSHEETPIISFTHPLSKSGTIRMSGTDVSLCIEYDDNTGSGKKLETYSAVGRTSIPMRYVNPGTYTAYLVAVDNNKQSYSDKITFKVMPSSPINNKINASLPKTVYDGSEAIVLSWTTEGSVNTQFNITVSKEPYTSADNMEVNNSVSGNSYTLKTLPGGKYRITVTEVKTNAPGTVSNTVDFEVKSPNRQIIATLPKTVYNEDEQIILSFTPEAVNNQGFEIFVMKAPGATHADDIYRDYISNGNTYTLKPLPVGKYRIAMKNNAWNVNSNIVDFEVKPGPVSKITANLPQNAYNTGESIILSWKIEPPLSANRTSPLSFGITIKNTANGSIAGEWKPVNYSVASGGVYSSSVPSLLQPGNYSVEIYELTDKSLQVRGMVSNTVNFEVQPKPVSKITAKLPQPSYNAGDPIILSWVTEGQVNPQFNVTVSKEPYTNADNVEVNNSVSGSSYTLKTLPAGKYRVKVTEVKGNALGVASNTVEFEVKKPQPDPKIALNLKNSYTEGEPVVLSWVTEGQVNPQFNVTVSKEPYTNADNVEVNNSVSGSSYTPKTLPAGKYRVKVTEVKGNALGVTSNTVEFEVKIPQPVAKITLNLKNTYTEGDPINLSWTTEGQVTGQFNVTVSKEPYTSADNVEVNNSVSGSSYTLKTLPAGKYRVKVTEVKGNALGVASNTVEFDVKIPQPVAKITLNLKNTYTEGEPINLSWITEGAVNPQFNVTVSKEPYTNADNIEVNNSVSGNSYTLKTLPAGKYRVKVTEVKGNALGVASNTVEFDVKIPQPNPKITLNLKDSYNEGEPVVLSWVTEGSVSNQFNVTVSKEPYASADNVEVNNSVSSNTYTLKTLPAGKYRVKVTEVKGNGLGVTSQAVDFEVKIIHISKIIAKLNQNEYIVGDKINLSWETEGTTLNQNFRIDVMRFPIEKNNRPAVSIAVTGNSYTLEEYLSDDKYSVEVIGWTMSPFEEIVSPPIYFEVKVIPKIILSLPKTVYNSGEPINVSWTPEGTVNNQFNVTVSKEPYTSADNVEVNSAVSGNSYTLKTLPVGNYRVKVTEVKGNAWGVTSQAVDFEVKTTPKIIAKLPKTVYRSGEQIEISWTAENAGNRGFKVFVEKEPYETSAKDYGTRDGYSCTINRYAERMDIGKYRATVAGYLHDVVDVVSQPVYFEVNSPKIIVSLPKTVYDSGEPINVSWKTEGEINSPFEIRVGRQGSSDLLINDRISGNSYTLKISDWVDISASAPSSRKYHVTIKELNGSGNVTVSGTINFEVQHIMSPTNKRDSTIKANHPTSFPWTGYLTETLSDGRNFGKKGDSIVVKADMKSYATEKYYYVEWSNGSLGYLNYSDINPSSTQQQDPQIPDKEITLTPTIIASLPKTVYQPSEPIDLSWSTIGAVNDKYAVIVKTSTGTTIFEQRYISGSNSYRFDIPQEGKYTVSIDEWKGDTRGISSKTIDFEVADFAKAAGDFIKNNGKFVCNYSIAGVTYYCYQTKSEVASDGKSLSLVSPSSPCEYLLDKNGSLVIDRQILLNWNYIVGVQSGINNRVYSVENLQNSLEALKKLGDELKSAEKDIQWGDIWVNTGIALGKITLYVNNALKGDLVSITADAYEDILKLSNYLVTKGKAEIVDMLWAINTQQFKTTVRLYEDAISILSNANNFSNNRLKSYENAVAISKTTSENMIYCLVGKVYAKYLNAKINSKIQTGSAAQVALCVDGVFTVIPDYYDDAVKTSVTPNTKTAYEEAAKFLKESAKVYEGYEAFNTGVTIVEQYFEFAVNVDNIGETISKKDIQNVQSGFEEFFKKSSDPDVYNMYNTIRRYQDSFDKRINGYYWPEDLPIQTNDELYIQYLQNRGADLFVTPSSK